MRTQPSTQVQATQAELRALKLQQTKQVAADGASPLGWLADAVRAADQSPPRQPESQQQQQRQEPVSKAATGDLWEFGCKMMRLFQRQREEDMRQRAAHLAQGQQQQQQQKDAGDQRAPTEQRDALLQESKRGCAAVPAAPAQGSAVADEDRIRALLRTFSSADQGLAVPAEQLPTLNSSNIARVAPAAHAAAQALLEQESAGTLGLGALHPGESAPLAGGGRGGSGVSAAEHKPDLLQTLEAINGLGNSYRSSYCTGAYGRRGMPSPPVPFSPQQFANFSPRYAQPAAAVHTHCGGGQRCNS